jgi:diguanylate cyclase (GGDEF)-like protein/PAS domain S-box-containing protein
VRRRLADTPPTAFPWIAAATGLIVTLIVTLIAAHHARVSADVEQRSDLALAAEVTRTSTSPVIDALDDLATLYARGADIPSRQLTLAAGKLLRNHVVTVVSVLRRVADSEREAFERRYGQIVEPDGRRRARRRSGYTVIMAGRSRGPSRVVTSPATGTSTFRDAAADAVRAPALERAVTTGLPSATRPTPGLGDSRPVVAVYLPVRTLSGAPSRTVVAVLFDTAVLAQTIAEALPHGLQVRVSDAGQSFRGGRVTPADAAHGVAVRVGGRRWTVDVDRVAPAWAGVLATAGVGISLTLLVVLGVGILVGREQLAHALAVRGARERDAAAQAAAEARRRSRFLEQNATDILFLTGPGGVLTYVSPAARTRLGLSPEQLYGRRLDALAHPDDAERLRDVIDHLDRTDDVVEITHRVRHDDGRWLWVETLLRAVRDARTGAFIEGQGSLRDVTRRREAERRLREAENRFRSAFDEAPLGMAVVGLDGELLQINRALCALCAWEESALRGTVFDALLHQADADTHRQARDALLDGELRAHNAELRIVQPSGDVVWTAISTALVLGGDGQPHHYLTQVQDISERRRAEAGLQYLADHDPLTGLLNRRAFERSLQEHLRRGRRYGVHGAVLVVDLDAFGAINTRIGATRGDALLAAVAQALRSRVRDSDLLARYGGDEFAVLLPQADLADALAVGTAIADAVRGVDAGEDVPAITASIGLALVDRPEQRGEELLSDADLAMYDAKQSGRDRLRAAASRPVERPRPRPIGDPAEPIREALREGRMVLHAEPVIDLLTREVVQLELHLRLRTRDGDLQSPAIFGPAAERGGLVQELDRWMIGQAAALLSAHHDGPGLAVNVSVRSLVGEALVDALGQELTTHNVDPRRLTIGLREHEAVAHLPRVQELARDLAHLGCPLALDDVGGGFGSFYFLKHLPFDVLRIDGGFVRHSACEHVDQVIIQSMVELAHGVGARTVAKQVQDEPTLGVLRDLEVDAAQGPAVAGPSPVLDAFREARRGRRT